MAAYNDAVSTESFLSALMLPTQKKKSIRTNVNPSRDTVLSRDGTLSTVGTIVVDELLESQMVPTPKRPSTKVAERPSNPEDGSDSDSDDSSDEDENQEEKEEEGKNNMNSTEPGRLNEHGMVLPNLNTIGTMHQKRRRPGISLQTTPMEMDRTSTEPELGKSSHSTET